MMDLILDERLVKSYLKKIHENVGLDFSHSRLHFIEWYFVLLNLSKKSCVGVCTYVSFAPAGHGPVFIYNI